MKKFEIFSGVANYKKSLKLGQEILKIAKEHIGILYFNDGLNIHLCESPKDYTENYTHISKQELSHIPIVESKFISIYKYQLIFTDEVYNIKVPLTLYKVYTTYDLTTQREIVEELETFYNMDLSVLYTISSKHGGHLPYHKDKFRWRYHQNLQFTQKEVLEFVDGDKVNLEINEAYTILQPNICHRLIAESGDKERIFLSASSK